ncbi:hypothetical protein LN650_18235 [Klebsiella pneumoniae subsp. pneumoniae]|nr:hypothetical protein [Klebsiella pneumoniae subsp. pneumoniae]
MRQRRRAERLVAAAGDLEQRDRDQTLVRFANGSVRVLVATDVAARGLDIKSLALVVNFELALGSEVHVHRIGRTARAGEQGLAISFCAPEEAQRAYWPTCCSFPLNWLPAPTAHIAPLTAEMGRRCVSTAGKRRKCAREMCWRPLTGDMGLMVPISAKLPSTGPRLCGGDPPEYGAEGG